MPKITITYPDATKETFNSLEALGDAYGSYRDQRLAADKDAKAVKERETALAAYLIDSVPKGDGRGTVGKVWQCVIKTNTVFKFIAETGFDEVWAYARKHNRADLFQRRLNETAVGEMYAAGKMVPGTQRMEVPVISLTKVKT